MDQDTLDKVTNWLADEGLIFIEGPRKGKFNHGSCCTCGHCGFTYDDCCCTQNDTTIAWNKFVEDPNG